MKYEEVKRKALEIKQRNLKDVTLSQCANSSDLNKTIDSLITYCDNYIERYNKFKTGRKVAEAYVNNLKKIVEKLY